MATRAEDSGLATRRVAGRRDDAIFGGDVEGRFRQEGEWRKDIESRG